MVNPKLSVIIITLNESYWIKKILESLKNQTFQDFEIIVSDYNSTDNTRDIAKSYGCKIVEGGNYTVGRNSGAKASKADYLLFLDADCILPDDFIEINFKAFKNSEKGSGTTEVKPISDKYFDKIFFKLYEYWSRIMQYFSPHCCGASIFTKKSVFEKVRGFDENICFAENHEYTKKTKGYGFIILPIPIFTSVRRMDKDGRLRFIIKYIYSGLYRLLYKEINHKLFEYDNKRTVN